MLHIYQTTAKEVKTKLKEVLTPYICGDYVILRTECGKPYIEGNPVYFSLAHCEDTAVIAIASNPVGIDLELIRERKFFAVLSRFTPREIDDISGSTVSFLKNWVAKEAYIKMTGGTLARDLKRLEFYGGKLYFNGVQKSVIFEDICGAICAVCLEENV